ncbi:hypothetical protein FHS55_004112 [Angulomicrobium tetraedrale]|uniref:Uncharacterized protein n=1 Tax=Ancylobacter tetraedralis TaxID=217068 RepID=A0A839ZFW9_9HYPH|nr:hypothetical protein [Ancylobacter tetraedralis]MBB3773475.1 hypothetical protein [Ancylobacter tetraedralis]
MIKAPGDRRGTMRGFARAALAAAVLMGIGAASLPAAAQSSITVRPPPGSGLPDWATPGSPTQDSGTPPTFQQYPFWSRIFGTGGLIFPGYTSPTSNDSSYQRLALLIGGGTGRVVFAAGMADTLCQPAGAPTLTVRNAPPGVTLTTDYGQFVATGNDAGSTFCRGRTVRGTRLILSGRAPRGGGSVTVRVSWPRIGRNGGTSYTHTVALPSK